MGGDKKLIKVNQSSLRDHQKIRRNFYIESHNIYELFNTRVKSNPKKIFVIFPGHNKTFLYEDLNKHIIEKSIYLSQKGITKGERISLILPTSPDFLVLYFAALKQGITVVPINPDLSSSEIAYIINDAQAKVVFYNGQLAEKLSGIQNHFDLTKVKFTNVSAIRTTDTQIETKAANLHYTDEAVVIYTSGTTGNPKGVILNHLNLLADSQVIAQWFNFTVDTRTLCILPLFHNNGQVITLLAPLYAGGSTVMVPPKTSLGLFWSLVDKYKVHWTSVMPSILSILLSLKFKRRDDSLTGIICGGQILNEEVKTKFESTFKVPIFEGYGLTETTSFACFNEFPENNKRGSVGRALSCNDIAIFDENDKEKATGKKGEICIRGLNVMNEYFGLGQVNINSLRGGWFHSGDYGYIDSAGYVYFGTRKDYLIIRGGENIYPSEIENVLFAHLAVDECAVIGIFDDLLGHEIVAFVKLNRKCTEGELKEFLINKLAFHKHPKRIFVINELSNLADIPKGPTKKVLYRKLLEYYNQHLK